MQNEMKDRNSFLVRNIQVIAAEQNIGHHVLADLLTTSEVNLGKIAKMFSRLEKEKEKKGML